jgi:hypothetical protein
MWILLIDKRPAQDCGDVLGQHVGHVGLIESLESRYQTFQRCEASLQLSGVERFVSPGDKSPVHDARASHNEFADDEDADE